uniref:EYE2 n=1 Tax=Chlamydomonas reinhardtii TaxID=3055 RepID=Q9M5B9_CHLRE|nr:EYE2 [Chlamydomonas reinhardtii]
MRALSPPLPSRLRASVSSAVGAHQPRHELCANGMRAAPACVGAAAAPERQSGGRSAGRSLTAARATAKADPTPAIVNYTVQKGETLWDVAVQHGVSMRTIKELNKLSGKEPLLKEGQQLLVPASGISQLAVMEAPATTTPVLGSVPARGMWVGSEYVRLATISDARQLYLSQCDRANSQNTLLVLYAPWCPHCREMEDELERLAEGLSHEQNVRVVAVNGDSPEGRIFSREVLGVAYYPSIISFPEHSRTFYKYKGRQRDAESLLRFLNMTCCSRAREDQMWTLRPAGTRSTVAALPGASTFLPIGMSPSALAAGVGSAALALVGIAASCARGAPCSQMWWLSWTAVWAACWGCCCARWAHAWRWCWGWAATRRHRPQPQWSQPCLPPQRRMLPPLRCRRRPQRLTLRRCRSMPQRLRRCQPRPQHWHPRQLLRRLSRWWSPRCLLLRRPRLWTPLRPPPRRPLQQRMATAWGRQQRPHLLLLGRLLLRRRRQCQQPLRLRAS